MHDDGVQRELRGTGMVLSGQQMLTAALVEQMDPPPEFVFINCCYSGDTLAGLPTDQAARDLPALAANLALAFIRMGSRAVVAAGWQVNDADGERFATKLYEELLHGEPFGRAVLAARQEAYHDGLARSNTWGAYQCYGDPLWRLSDADPAAAAADDGTAIWRDLRSALRCKSPHELAERIAQLPAVAGDAPDAVLVDALTDLVHALAADPVRQPWLQDAEVLTRLGEAWRELRQWQPALEAFFAAAGQAHSALSLNHAEFAANMASRLRGGPGEPGSMGAQASLALLERLDALESALSWQAFAPGDGADRPGSLARAERDCLQGSTLARQADDSRLAPEARAALLLRAASHYARAHRDRRALGAAASARAYALSNAVVLAGMAARYDAAAGAQVAAGGWLQGAPGAAAGADAPDALDALLDDIGGLLAELAGQGVDFWGYAGLVDLRLGRQMLWLALGREPAAVNDADLAALPEMAEVALLRWPSPTQLDSLGGRPRQVLAALLAGPQDAPLRAALAQAVQRLVDRLDAARRRLDGA